jgi:hypothetical protein
MRGIRFVACLGERAIVAPLARLRGEEGALVEEGVDVEEESRGVRRVELDRFRFDM